ncbi:aldo/keto reductase [Luteipulveratus mongoliensis]|uniref:Aldo/keto reductase n=1 Tax=Luteipulveratus mongoliensis TaxID=571913 RepID=A0A0K1JQ85_9MICO|nr:aldo/keto reductase [Luteipulveratus mongoliensis]AKU18710.1 aldo/keto reductase [Luteipulveratus mongoliensis]
MDQVGLPHRTRVRLSRLGFGAAMLGNLYRAMDDETARETVAAAYDSGVRYFDTAPHYGLGLAERRLGDALSAYPRSDYVVSTKVGRLLVPRDVAPGERDAEGFDVPATHDRVRDYSRDGVRRSLDSSLERMALDHIDIALVHDPDEHWEQASREAVPALCELRDEGVIGAVGIGMNQSAMLTRFVDETDVDVVMCAGRFTLLEQPALADLLPAALARGVGVVAVGVFNSGVLAADSVPDDATYDYVQADREVLDRARRIRDICHSHGVELPRAAVQFALSHPAVVSATVGIGTPEMARQDAALLEPFDTTALWSDLAASGLIDARILEAV